MSDYRNFDFDAEGRDDIIRMEIEYDAYLRAVHEAPIKDVWTQEVSDMYAELDFYDDGPDCG